MAMLVSSTNLRTIAIAVVALGCVSALAYSLSSSRDSAQLLSELQEARRLASSALTKQLELQQLNSKDVQLLCANTVENKAAQEVQTKLTACQSHVNLLTNDLTKAKETIHVAATALQAAGVARTAAEKALADATNSASSGNRFVLVEANEEKRARQNGEKTVLILSPMKDRGAGGVRSFLQQIGALSYPKHLISIAILEGDSHDDTFTVLNSEMSQLSEYHSLILIKKDFHITGWGDRHALGIQKERRAVMARARNYLLMSALRDEEWVLWLDSDLSSLPNDLIERLLGSGKTIVVPNCVMDRGGRSYDLNSFQETEQSRRAQAAFPESQLVFEGYAETDLHRKHLSDLRQDGETVPLDGVGGTALLILGDIHREGLVFPTFPFHHQIETEGLAKMAIAMGHQPYGMPNLEIMHK